MPTDKMLIQLSFANEAEKHYGNEIDPTGAEKNQHSNTTTEAPAGVRKHQ